MARKYLLDYNTEQYKILSGGKDATIYVFDNPKSSNRATVFVFWEARRAARVRIVSMDKNLTHVYPNSDKLYDLATATRIFYMMTELVG